MQAAQFLGRQPFPDSVDGLIEQTVMFHALQREHDDDDFEVWESSGLGGRGDGIFYDVHEATVAEQGVLGHLVRPRSPKLNQLFQMVHQYVLHLRRHQYHVRMLRWLLVHHQPKYQAHLLGVNVAK